MTGNPHFETARTWKAAHAMLEFKPRQPRHTAGLRLQSLRIHVRDHKQRELPVAERTLEAHYGRFVLSQVRKDAAEARRLAIEVSYGRTPKDIQIAGCAGRAYERGPEPEQDDIDRRSPSVVVWHDGEMVYLIASDQMASSDLVRIARSLYPRELFRLPRPRYRSRGNENV